MTREAGPRLAGETLEQEARDLYDAMSDLIKVYQFRDRDRTHCHGISVTECYALEAVDRHGPLRLGDLARTLHLEKSTTSRVSGLEKSRYQRGVTRIPWLRTEWGLQMNQK